MFSSRKNGIINSASPTAPHRKTRLTPKRSLQYPAPGIVINLITLQIITPITPTLLSAPTNIAPNQEKREQKKGHANIRTFASVAREWHKSNRKWDPAHARRVLTSLETHLFPALGECDITKLNTRDLLTPVKVVEARDNIDTAGRLQSRIMNIMRYAVQNAYITYNPALDMKGAVSPQKTEHRPALPFHSVTDLLEKINSYRGQPLTILAIRLALLIFIRSSELRFARWPEIDFKRALWTLPDKREEITGVRFSTRGAKMRTPHLIPLCKQATGILEQIHTITVNTN